MTESVLNAGLFRKVLEASISSAENVGVESDDIVVVLSKLRSQEVEAGPE